jgi:TatA/E family protein of Tat protein translocase
LLPSSKTLPLDALSRSGPHRRYDPAHEFLEPREKERRVSLGPAEVLVIFVIALLVFGPNRLPEIGRQVGRGVRELRKLQASLKSDLDDVLADDSPRPAEPAPELPPLVSPTPPIESNDPTPPPDPT